MKSMKRDYTEQTITDVQYRIDEMQSELEKMIAGLREAQKKLCVYMNKTDATRIEYEKLMKSLYQKEMECKLECDYLSIQIEKIKEQIIYAENKKQILEECLEEQRKEKQ